MRLNPPPAAARPRLLPGYSSTTSSSGHMPPPSRLASAALAPNSSAADRAGAAERIDMEGRQVKRMRRCTACTIGAMHDGGNGDTLLTLISHST